MWVQRAYKTELDLNDQQITARKQHAGAARWAYNWGLRVKQQRYKASKKSPTAIALHREFNALKKTQVPWMYDVSKCAPQEALWNLDAAFANFFRRCALKKQGKWKSKLGYPQVKTKKQGLGSFRLTGRIVVLEKAVVLPRLGRLRLKERGYLPTGGEVQILSATVSEQEAGHWYVSVQVEEEQAVPENIGPVVGVDLGIKSLATLSDGEVIPNPRYLKRRLKKLKRQLLYKATWYGSSVILVNRWEPSSKRCSRCGWIDVDLTLSDRVYHCQQCGLVLDRDLNAAVNLEKLAGSFLGQSKRSVRATSAGTKHTPRVQLAAKKQEPNAEHGLSRLG